MYKEVEWNSEDIGYKVEITDKGYNIIKFIFDQSKFQPISRVIVDGDNAIMNMSYCFHKYEGAIDSLSSIIDFKIDRLMKFKSMLGKLDNPEKDSVSFYKTPIIEGSNILDYKIINSYENSHIRKIGF
jgi:hypothetical protein